MVLNFLNKFFDQIVSDLKDLILLFLNFTELL